ncbi:alpha/beta-hydrolase [Mycena leptocephala]|nr:alpha/beta-hydrolase [Mycena leptocephala]
MQLFVFVSLLIAVRAVVVPPVDSSGHFHSPLPTDVVPQGKNITINGVLTYVSLPKGRFDRTTAVLMLTVKADQWAAAGFATYAPDYLNGDALPTGGNVTAWAVNHGEAQTTPPLLAVISALKSHGIKQIATTGYCFGGLYTTRLVQNNTITVGTMAHPSSLNVPTDFELVKAQAHVPVEINNAELDTGFTPALAIETDAFAGVAHGFASDPVQVAAKQGAFDTSLAFIKKHLK